MIISQIFLNSLTDIIDFLTFYFHHVHDRGHTLHPSGHCLPLHQGEALLKVQPDQVEQFLLPGAGSDPGKPKPWHQLTRRVQVRQLGRTKARW